jgi:hypothetical protein
MAAAAAKCGVPKQTLHDAIGRGHVRAEWTACGLPLVTLADVRHYLAHRPKRGRKTKT